MANEFIARNGIISRGNLLVTGSLTTSGSLTATGTITATTLVVQTVTSSISSITGSTNFGSLSSNTHTFTGSILASGSATFAGNANINGEILTIGGTTNNAIINNIASIRLNIDSDNTGTGESFTIGHNQTGINDSNVLFRVKDDGNVGIGTSSPAYALDISGSTVRVKSAGGYGGFIADNTGTTGGGYFSAARNGTGIGFFGVSGAVLGDTSNDIIIFNDASTNIRFSTSNTERMRITSTGNVGIGSTSASTKLVVVGGTSNAGSSTSDYTVALQDPTSMAAGVGGSILFQGYKVGTSNIGNYAYVAGKKDNGTSGNEAGYLAFGTFDGSGIPAEKMRLTPQSGNGNLVVGGTTVANADAGRGVVAANGTLNALLGLQVGNNEYGYIYHGGSNGNMYLNNSRGNATTYVISSSNGVYLATNATSWTANSDIRLKNINSNIENALDKLLTLRAVNYSWKSDETNKENLGLIAQDVEAVFPQVIDRSKLPSKANEEQTDDTEYLGVRYQELVPVLVKAIQELTARIQELENK